MTSDIYFANVYFKEKVICVRFNFTAKASLMSERASYI